MGRPRGRALGGLLALLLVWAVGLPSAARADDVNVDRIAGQDRFATAAALSAAAFPHGASRVLLATGEAFPDALAGGPATAGTSPLLLVTRHTVPPATLEELRRLRPREVVILGGDAAVGPAVAQTVSRVLGASTTRIAGRTRYDTAARIATEMFPTGVDAVYVGTGEAFPDALAAGPAAGAGGNPVLLTAADTLPKETLEALQHLRPGRVLIVGGTAAVSEEVARAIERATAAPATRVAGPTRFATAVAVSRQQFQTAGTVVLATGETFPDAIAAGVVGARWRAPLLLVGRDHLPVEVACELVRLRPRRVVVLGGTAAISDTVTEEARRHAVGRSRPGCPPPPAEPEADPLPDSPLPVDPLPADPLPDVAPAPSPSPSPSPPSPSPSPSPSTPPSPPPNPPDEAVRTHAVGVAGAPLDEVAISPDGRYAFASNTALHQIEVLDLRTGRLEAPIEVATQPRGLDVSADGTRLYVATHGTQSLSVVDVAERRELERVLFPRLPVSVARPRSLAALADGRVLVTTTAGVHRFSGNGHAWLFDPSDGSLQQRDAGWGGSLRGQTRVRASGDRTSAAIVGIDGSPGEVVWYDGDSDEFTTPLRPSESSWWVAVDHGGNRALTGPDTAVVDGQGVVKDRGGFGGAVEISHDGDTGYQVAGDTLRVLDLPEMTIRATLELQHGQGQGTARLTPDEHLLVMATATGLEVVDLMGSGLACSRSSSSSCSRSRS